MRISKVMILGLAGLWGAAHGLAPSEVVENFRLMDNTGGSHHLYYFSDMEAVVLMADSAQCAVAADSRHKLEKLQREADGSVQVLLLDSSGSAVTADGVPVLVDDAQLVAAALELNEAGEVLVVDPKSWTLAYRGGVNATFDAALAAVRAGEAVEKAESNTGGCAVEVAQPDGTALTYVEHIAPILEKNCVSCHREGGIGPWQMNSYLLVRGFAPMIREVLMTKRMPPWHADPTVGHWGNDRSLSVADRQAIVAWADAGAPRGEGEDPLVGLVHDNSVWGALGEPDLVIDIPATDVPASGVVDYQYKYVQNPLDRDVWVRASQIVPGDRTVLHHVITRAGHLETEGPRKGRLSNRSSIGGLAGYVPGMVVRALPEGTGTFLPAGAHLEFQMHYTTSGKASTDSSKIGIYFYDEEPEFPIRNMILANGRLKIPPHAKAHAEQAVQEFKNDALLYSILPHAHYRGKAARFVAKYPDGTEEVLLNVPNYDFNWQTTYEFAEPKVVPAGTKIVYTNWWDNSAQNPANPDPTREVPWGDQSFDEMIFGVVTYRDATQWEAEQLAGGR